MMFKRCISLGIVFAVVSLGGSAAVLASSHESVPITCNRGPSNQKFDVAVSVPPTVRGEDAFTVRIDGTPSGRISHVGLNNIHDMTSEYVIPPGMKYVDGSARILPETGTANVRAGARISHQNGVIRVQLPAHVDNDSSYTAPSVEFKLTTTAAAGSSVGFDFVRYGLTANAIVVGDVNVTCAPQAPYRVGTSKVVQ